MFDSLMLNLYPHFSERKSVEGGASGCRICIRFSNLSGFRLEAVYYKCSGKGEEEEEEAVREVF
jgi:hypothetical protein